MRRGLFRLSRLGRDDGNQTWFLLKSVNGGYMRLRPRRSGCHGLFMLRRQRFQFLFVAFGFGNFLQHGLMTGAQRGNTLLEGRQLGLITFPDSIKRGSNVLQLAFQIAERVLVTLVRGMRGIPLLFEALDFSLGLSKFVRPRLRLLSGTVIRLL